MFGVVRPLAIGTALAVVACCTLKWADARDASVVAAPATSGAEAPHETPTLADLDDTRPFACDNAKSQWAHMTVAQIALPVDVARDSRRPLQARTSLAAYRYPSWFRSRAPPQQA